MAHCLPHFVPVQLSAKPPENGQSQEAERPKLYIFSSIRLQELLNRATRKNLNHKILGRAKATTVHNTEQEGLGRVRQAVPQFTFPIVFRENWQAKA